MKLLLTSIILIVGSSIWAETFRQLPAFEEDQVEEAKGMLGFYFPNSFFVKEHKFFAIRKSFDNIVTKLLASGINMDYRFGNDIQNILFYHDKLCSYIEKEIQFELLQSASISEAKVKVNIRGKIPLVLIYAKSIGTVLEDDIRGISGFIVCFLGSPEASILFCHDLSQFYCRIPLQDSKEMVSLNKDSIISSDKVVEMLRYYSINAEKHGNDQVLVPDNLYFSILAKLRSCKLTSTPFEMPSLKSHVFNQTTIKELELERELLGTLLRQKNLFALEISAQISETNEVKIVIDSNSPYNKEIKQDNIEKDINEILKSKGYTERQVIFLEKVRELQVKPGKMNAKSNPEIKQLFKKLSLPEFRSKKEADSFFDDAYQLVKFKTNRKSAIKDLNDIPLSDIRPTLVNMINENGNKKYTYEALCFYLFRDPNKAEFLLPLCIKSNNNRLIGKALNYIKLLKLKNRSLKEGTKELCKSLIKNNEVNNDNAFVKIFAVQILLDDINASNGYDILAKAIHTNKREFNEFQFSYNEAIRTIIEVYKEKKDSVIMDKLIENIDNSEMGKYRTIDLIAVLKGKTEDRIYKHSQLPTPEEKAILNKYFLLIGK